MPYPEDIEDGVDGTILESSVQFGPFHRSTGGSAHPAPDSETAADDLRQLEVSEAGEGVSTVREDVESSLRYLNSISLKPAILLARAWQVEGTPFAFEHLDLYRQVAAESQCSIVEIARPEAGGVEHLLFATRTAGLSEDEYLNCIREPVEPQP